MPVGVGCISWTTTGLRLIHGDERLVEFAILQWQRPEEGADASNEEEEVFRDKLWMIDLILMDRGEIGAAETFQKHSL